MSGPWTYNVATDISEQIKQRVFALLGSVEGFIAAHRDRGQLASQDVETKAPLLPAGVLLDGNEYPVAEDQGMQGQSRRGQLPPVTVIWEPQIFIVLMPRLTVDNAGVGEELSAFRVKVHRALTTDRTLYSMLGENGGITYLGYETDMQQGSELRGQMRLDYRFAYVFSNQT